MGKPCSGKATLASKLSKVLGCVHIGIPQILTSALNGHRLITNVRKEREEAETIKLKLAEEGTENADELRKTLEELEVSIKAKEHEISQLPRDEENTAETEIPTEFTEAATVLLSGSAVSGEQLDRLFQVDA